jgi:hypothetical protein
MKQRIRNFLENIVSKAIKKALIEQSANMANINENTKRIAHMQTAEYVLANMQSACSLNSNFELYDYIANNIKIDGEILEFGVYQGGSISYLSNKFKNNTLYGFDSFEGLPERWRIGFDKGAFNLNGQLPSVPNNVVLIKGWFDESLPIFLEQNCILKVGLLHVDCDLYSSTKDIFRMLEDKIFTGTVIIFDEYFNYDGWQNGEFKAFQEFISDKKFTYDYIAFNSNHEQVALIIK